MHRFTLALSIVVAACGGSVTEDDVVVGPSGDDPVSTHAQRVATCDAANQLAASTPPVDPIARHRAYHACLTAANEALAAEIDALVPPGAASRTLSSVVAELESIADEACVASASSDCRATHSRALAGVISGDNAKRCGDLFARALEVDETGAVIVDASLALTDCVVAAAR